MAVDADDPLRDEILKLFAHRQLTEALDYLRRHPATPKGHLFELADGVHLVYLGMLTVRGRAVLPPIEMPATVKPTVTEPPIPKRKSRRITQPSEPRKPFAELGATLRRLLRQASTTEEREAKVIIARAGFEVDSHYRDCITKLKRQGWLLVGPDGGLLLAEELPPA